MNKGMNPTMHGGAAPPLPPGQPPAQPDQAAVAQAWNLYYAQQAAAVSGVGMMPQQPQQQQPQQGYSNYGYGPAGPNAGAAMAQQPSPYGTSPATMVAPLGYAQPRPAYPYGQPQPTPYMGQHPPQQQHQPQHQQQQQAPMMAPGYGQQPAYPQQPAPMIQPQGPYQPQSQGYRPPQPTGPQTGYNPPNGPAQRARPPQQQPFQGPYGGGGASPPANNMRPRPAQNGTGTYAGSPGGQAFPPAKRPRVDGPAPGGPRSMNMTAPPRGGGNFAPTGPRPAVPVKHTGFNPGITGPSGRGAFGAGRGGSPMRGGRGGHGGIVADRDGYAGRGGFSGRGGGPGVGNVSVAGNRVLSAQRGGALAARGRGGSFTSIRGGMGVGAAGAPRGPKAAPVRDSKASAAAPKRGPLTVEEKEKLKEKEKLATEEARRRTLTDFRIVGLEIKQLDWSWGQLRAEDDDEEEEEEEEREPAAKDEVDSGNDSDADNTGGHDEDEAEEKVLITAEAEVYDVVPQVAPVKATTDVKAEEEIKKEIKEEDAESAEVKRGEKRKAKMSSPEPDDDERIVAKKRATRENGTVHNADAKEPAVKPPLSSEKNRFRIYFASPVEKGDGPSASSQTSHNDETPGEVEGEAEETEGEDKAVADEVTGGPDNVVDEDEEQGDEEVFHEADAETGTEVEAEVDDENQADESGAEEYLDGTVEDEKEPVAQNLEEDDQPGVETVQPVETGTETEIETEPANANANAEANAEAKAEAEPESTVAESEKEGEKVTTDAETTAKEAVKVAELIKVSAKNASAAYESRKGDARLPSEAAGAYKHRTFRRSPSLPPTSSDEPAPEPNRLSILYGNGQQRISLDASLIESVKIFRKRGYIQVAINLPQTDDKETTGHLLLEHLDSERNAFMPATPAEDKALPPFTERPSNVVVLTAFLDRDHPLSEPKWVKSGQLEDWIRSVRGSGAPAKGRAALEKGWESKLEIVDPDVPLTINHVLEAWALHSKIGNLKDRRRFIHSSFNSVNDVTQILLRVIRGDEIPLSRSQIPRLHGPLRTAIRSTSEHFAQQTPVTLAIMAIVNLAKDYSYDLNEKSNVLMAQIGDIIKSLPNALIYKSVDKLFEENLGSDKKKRK